MGPYRLIRELGSGGMGRVFLGQSRGGRPVAVKVIRADLSADPEFRERFRREVAAARKVNGLYTALVVDADIDGPTQWLATAYVAGPSLADSVGRYGPLGAASVRALAAGLAEGLRAIHKVGLIHRDLKPSNVLLADDGPRVIDFGISRTAEAGTLTRTGLVIGSPGFMSPEQAEGGEVGPPSDIFSLGAVLTFAASGHGPFGTGPTAALIYRVVHGPPALDHVPEQIRSLVEQCLAKDPDRRPTTEDLLAELGDPDLDDGWLSATRTGGSIGAETTGRGQPTQSAVLPSPQEHPSTVTYASPGIVDSSSSDTARQFQEVADTGIPPDAQPARRPDGAGTVAEPPLAVAAEISPPPTLSRTPGVAVVPSHLDRTLNGHTGQILGMAFSPDGWLLATASSDGTARVWDVATGGCLRTLAGHTEWVYGVAFSPDGRRLATANGDDKTAQVWDMTTGECVQTLVGHTKWVYGVAFSPAGQRLATASSDGTARLWDPTNGHCLRVLGGHSREVISVAFSPDGGLLASAGDDQTARLWDPATGIWIRTLRGHSGAVWDVVFSGDGRLLATGSQDKTARVWDPVTGDCLCTLTGHTAWVISVAFSRDGRLLATAGRDDRTARVWDPATGDCLCTLTGHDGKVTAVAFSPNERLLATAEDDGTVRMWD